MLYALYVLCNLQVSIGACRKMENMFHRVLQPSTARLGLVLICRVWPRRESLHDTKNYRKFFKPLDAWD